MRNKVSAIEDTFDIAPSRIVPVSHLCMSESYAKEGALVTRFGRDRSRVNELRQCPPGMSRFTRFHDSQIVLHAENPGYTLGPNVRNIAI